MKALVTGASRGIGRAIAEALIAEGMEVVVCASSDAPEVRGAALSRRCDVADEASVRALFAASGRCDCVVLNAGVLERGPIEGFTAAQWDRVLGVNLRGAFLCAREAFRSGATRIVAVGSISGTLGTPHAAAYNASKWGLTGLTKSWAIELAPHDIRVVSIHPTGVDTPLNDGLAMLEGKTTEEIAEQSAGNLQPVPWIEAQDVADAVVFLVSDKARYMTGTELVIDAGLLTK